MTRAPVLVLVLVLVLCLASVPTAASQGTLDAIHVVERFAGALNAGDIGNARAELGGVFTWSEHDLVPWVATSRAEALLRVIELIGGGVRLETEPVAVVAGGSMVIAHERMWGAFVPDELAPLRSTTVYLVAGGRLVGITRMLAGDQRDALAAAAVVGTWRFGEFHFRIDADGSYRTFGNQDHLLADRHHDSGTATVERGVLVWVSDDASDACDPGDRTTFSLQTIDRDTIHLAPLTDQITCAVHWTAMPSTVTLHLLRED